jgi:hypothetical protein
MTAATDLIAALEPQLGRADANIHTALPPLHLGGGADVVVFPTSPFGVVYVSAGLGASKQAELMLCVREKADWCAPFLSQLAAATRARPLPRNGTTPLEGGPFEGVAITTLATVFSAKVPGHPHGLPLNLVVGVTRDELAVCRTHGVSHVVALLVKAGSFPQSRRDRPSVVDPTTIGPAFVDAPGLSPAGKEALAAVVHGDGNAVEMLRNRFPKSDLPILALVYDRFIDFHQRVDLVFLTCDSITPELQAMCRKYVRDALAVHAQKPIATMDAEHAALATSLAMLDGDLKRFDSYYDDVEVAIASARTR